MRRIALLGLIGLLVLAGCNAAPTPLPTAASLPADTDAAPAATVPAADLPTPTVEAATQPPLPTATPGYLLGGGITTLDEPFPAALLPDVPARFTFQGERLQTFAITVTPLDEAVDVQVTLLDPLANPLLVVDRGGVGVVESIPELGLPVSGTFTVLVESVAAEGATAASGDIETLVTRLTPEEHSGGGTITLDGNSGTAEGAFTAPGVLHAYSVAVMTGSVLVFEVASEAPDVLPTFTLLDGSGVGLGSYTAATDGGSAVARSSDIYIPFDGTYTLLVGNQGGGTGDYTVSVLPE